MNYESFGENLTSITDDVFENINEDDYYKFILKQLAKIYNLEEINEYFLNKLSLNAKIFYSGIYDE